MSPWPCSLNDCQMASSAGVAAEADSADGDDALGVIACWASASFAGWLAAVVAVVVFEEVVEGVGIAGEGDGAESPRSREEGTRAVGGRR